MTVMRQDKIVKMANDIGAFYQSDPDHDAAIVAMLSHISRFWAKRMREKLIAHAKEADSGLSPLSLAVAERLAAASVTTALKS